MKTKRLYNEALLSKICNYILASCRPEKIVLFGSYAHGSENKYSDLDIIVICEEVYMRKTIERRIISNIERYALKADVLVRSVSEVSRSSQEPGSFLGEVLKKGVIIYEKC